MNYIEKSKAIASLSADQQVKLLRAAARATEPRSVRGNTGSRFYAHECGFSRRVVSAMREEGHGEKIFSGRGANSGRWYFPMEILDRAADALASSHAQIKLYAEGGNK
jgi:hypothetical protein